MYHGEEFYIGDIEQWTAGKGSEETDNENILRRDKYAWEEISEGSCKSKCEHEKNLFFTLKMWLSQKRHQRKRDGDLVDSNSCEYSDTKFSAHVHSSPYPDPIKDSVEEDGNPRNDNYMVQVFMWVFVGMVTMFMIVVMRCEEFFYQINNQKPSNKSIDSKRVALDGFREDMDERDWEHSTPSERDEEMENLLWDILPDVQNKPNTRYQKKANKNENWRHKKS